MDTSSYELLKKEMRMEKFGLLLKPDNFIDNTQTFHDNKPFFYDKNKLFWFWSDEEHRYYRTDEIELFNALENLFNWGGITVRKELRSSYLESFKRVGRKMFPKDAPVKWIQFQDKAFSIESGNIYDVKPNYFFTNPIPHEIGVITNTPVMDKLFSEWVGEENIQTLYEFLAYSCYRYYPIHRIFCLVGSGRNGKSQFLSIVRHFLGHSNVVSTELDTLLDSRFESAKLYRKLACTLGETNFGTLTKTSLLKRLSGQDLIGFEFKNKDPFDEMNYAKIIIASNSMPHTDDNSDGFFRRFLVIDFPNEFEEGNDVWKTIPDEEYRNLAFKITQMLPELLRKGSFTNEGTIQDRKHKYTMVSNPFPIFIQSNFEIDPNAYISYNDFYLKYISYLKSHKKRIVNKKEFSKLLDLEIIETKRTYMKTSENAEPEFALWVFGFRQKTCNILQKNPINAICSICSESEFTYKAEQPSENFCKSSKSRKESQNNLQHIAKNAQKPQYRDFKIAFKTDKTYTKCVECGDSPCYYHNHKGQPLCSSCGENVNRKEENMR